MSYPQCFTDGDEGGLSLSSQDAKLQDSLWLEFEKASEARLD